MFSGSPQICRAAVASGLAFLAICARSAPLMGSPAVDGQLPTNDPVVARVYEHFGDSPRPIVLAVDSRQFPPGVWQRVRTLVAFRLHRPEPDGTTRTDAAIYLVRESSLYLRAAAALRNQTTTYEYIWCQLAAVLVHEAAHTSPLTERQALMAEAAQLRRCLFATHLQAGNGWNPLKYLHQVEAKLRNPREHY